VLSERSRSQIYQGLAPIIGEEATGEMLAHYPATEGEQPITKAYLDAKVNELRVEMSELHVEMHKQTKQLLIWIPTAIAAISTATTVIGRITT
jgi:hypothetical protein